MRSLSELTGQDLIWQVQPGSASIPDEAQHSYVLFKGDEPVVQAQVMWKRMVSFEVIMEAGEGTYQVHMDLADPARRSVVWKTGVAQSAAGFELVSESMITCTGWINTAGLRKLALAPTREIGYEYVLFVPGGPRLITLAAAASVHIGGNSGEMTLAPEMAGDADLAPLVAMAFALANEQVMLLHRALPTQEEMKAARDNPEFAGQQMSLEDLIGLVRGKPPDDLLRLLGGNAPPGGKPPGT